MRAAFYECDITPPIGDFVWGLYRDARPTDVKDRLYARAAVVEGADGTVAAFVAVDCCALPVGIHEKVTARIFEYTGISPEHVCISSNHTHWGAPVSDSPEIDCYADKAYLNVFLRLTADAVILAYKRLDSAEAYYGEGLAEDVAFCRNFILKDGRCVTWARDVSPDVVVGRNAEADPTVRTVIIKRNGTPIGALVNFACHQCTAKRDAYTGDFSSTMSKELKRIYGENFVSIYIPGAAGDITHQKTNDFIPPPDLCGIIGRKLANAVVEANKSPKALCGEVEVAFEKINIPHRNLSPEETESEIERLKNSFAGEMRARNLAYYKNVATESGDYALQAIRLGELCIYAMPGEAFADVGRRVTDNSDYDFRILIHNCNTYCGYIPTKEAFGENYDLYETSLCYHSCLIPEAGEIMTDKLLELGEAIKK